MINDDSPPRQDAEAEEKAVFTGEENTGERSTSKKDLIAAGVVAVLSIVAMYYAWLLPIPTRITTAPGMLPFLTGLTLLVMALGLGLKALRKGALEGFFEGTGAFFGNYFKDQENRRTLLLMTLIFAWVVIVGHVSLDIRVPTPFHVFRFSGFEAVSIPMLILILRIFWQASLARCSLVSIIAIVALASAFRDGFKILLPEGI
ncbi:MAG: hypothetical protein O3A85_09005 [Proteobacteria bacterium]|nr:hypothetical protein [Pseudomonadota bacterium]